jgi:hypothetical protein
MGQGMRTTAAIAGTLGAWVIAAGCAAHARPGSATWPGGAGTAAAPAPALEEDLLGWLTIRRLDEATSGLSRGSARELERQLLGAVLGAPAVSDSLDPTRPVVVALVDPARHQAPHAVPLVLALPLTSRQDFEAALETSAAAVEPREANGAPRGYQSRSGARLFVTYGAGSAFVGFDAAMAAGAPALLGRLQARRPRSALLAHLVLPRLARAFGSDFDEALRGLFATIAPGQSGDPRFVWETRALSHVLEAARGAEVVEITLDPSSGSAQLGVRLEGSPASALGRLAQAAQRHGAESPWGAELCPPDAVLFYQTRAAPTRADADDLATYLATLGAAPALGGAATWRSALAALAETASGEQVFLVWPSDKGLGAGGAFRLLSGDADARARWLDGYRVLGPVLGDALAVELGLDPQKVRFQVRPARAGGPALAGVAVDRIEFVPRFGESADKERRLVRWYLGEVPTLAFAVLPDRVVWAAGHDWRARLETMIRASHPQAEARGGLPGALAPGVTGRVSVSYVSTPRLAQFIATALAQAGPLAAHEQAMLEPFLHAGDDAAVVTTTRAFDGPRPGFEVTSRVPAAALGSLPSVGGAMWRISLGLLIGPPALLPVPAPPRALSPPADARRPRPPGPPPPTGPGNRTDLPTGHGT